MTITNDILTLAAIVAAIVGVFKTMGLNPKYSPLSALGVAAIFVLIPGDWQTQLITICVIGLTAAGVYHYSKPGDGLSFGSSKRALRPYPINSEVAAFIQPPEQPNPRRIYNHKPDPIDTRDKLFAPLDTTTLPASVDLRPKMSAVVDQGQLGSCTANAIASGMREYMELQAGNPLIPLSRLYLYWQERSIEGTINSDSGAYIRDGLKALQQIGVCPEVDYPYDITKFTNTPSAQADMDAAAYKIAEYHRILTYDDMLAALANGQPVVIGIMVYDSFESFDVSCGGLLPDVNKSKENMLGGHCVCAVGYNPVEHPGDYVIIRNSWGTNWGDQGYCYMPKSYWDQGLVTDMWTATLTKQPITPDKITADQSFQHFADVGVIDNPPTTWLGMDGDAPTAEQVKYIPLLVRKLAARDINLTEL